jgi:uncharacterized membrane protein YeaQ/YmgE (transglycosylase-associated protein family)
VSTRYPEGVVAPVHGGKCYAIATLAKRRPDPCPASVVGTRGSMIGFIVFGLVVGAIARLLAPGRQRLSFLATLVLGLVGSVVGGVVANALGTGDLFELNVLGGLVAIGTAFVLILAGEGLGAINERAERRS